MAWSYEPPRVDRQKEWMMRTLLGIAALTFGMALSACAPPPFDAVGEGKKLAARDAEWAEVSLAGKDIGKIVSYWTDDARVILPGQPVYDGKAAIRGFVTEALKLPGFKIHWVSEPPVFSADGTMAYLSGVVETTMADDKGVVTTTKGRALTVWRKDSDGQYRCVMDINNDPPVSS
jgi:ketosteroid isomerase-like protein